MHNKALSDSREGNKEGKVSMPYNLDLEDRIDRFANRFGTISKKNMFGGVCYLLNGNMIFGIHKDSLMIRTTPAIADKLLKNENFSVFDFTGKPMKGWVLASLDAVDTEDQLLEMLQIGTDYVSKLPGKQ